MRTRTIALLITLLAPAPALMAQAGVPGARVEIGRDYRATVRAEAYNSVTIFTTKWRETWQKRDADEMIRVYVDDAVVRLPGKPVVRTRTPVVNALRAAIAVGAPIELSDIDFHSDGETAMLISCYFTRHENREVTGLVTTILLRSSRSWKVRAHMFDAPHPVGSGSERFAC